MIVWARLPNNAPVIGLCAGKDGELYAATTEGIAIVRRGDGLSEKELAVLAESERINEKGKT